MGGGGGGGGAYLECARHVRSACITTCIFCFIAYCMTSNPLGFLTDIIAEAYDLACAVDVRHWWSFSRRLPFLGRPTGRFAVVSTCPRSLGKNDEARCLILVDGFEKQSNLSHSACARLDFAPARAIEAPKVVFRRRLKLIVTLRSASYFRAHKITIRSRGRLLLLGRRLY